MNEKFTRKIGMKIKNKSINSFAFVNSSRLPPNTQTPKHINATVTVTVIRRHLNYGIKSIVVPLSNSIHY
jgi:hypothetical protein